MAIPLTRRTSYVTGRRAGSLTRLLVERGIFSKDEFLEMVNVVDREMKRKKKVAV
jgi:hypothetical protein